MPRGRSVIIKRDCRCARAQHQHGTRNAYDTDNCRCLPCQRAKKRSDYYGPGFRDAGAPGHRIGVIRRLEALHAIGWSGPALADRLGITRDALNNIRCWPTDLVFASTVRNINTLYDELWDQRPPMWTQGERISVARTLGWARRNGFVPPLAWDDDTIDDPNAEPCLAPTDVSDGPDEVAVDLILGGVLRVPRDSRAPERIEAVRRLAAAGFSDGEVAARLGVRKSGVQKLRARHGIRSRIAPSSGERVA